MVDLKIVIEPLMGTVIGWGTNFIAVKMLFRPYNPIKIGKFTLPFTPGVLPKRRNQFAEALGEMISKELFTSEDIKNLFLSENVKNIVVNSVANEIVNNDNTIKENLLKNISEEQFSKFQSSLENYIAEKFVNALLNIELGNLVAEEGYKSVKEKLKGSFLGTFINDDFIASFLVSLSDTIDKYIREQGKEKTLPYINNEVEEIIKHTPAELFENLNISEEKFKKVIEKIYTKIVLDKMNNIFNNFNISEVVAKKIKEMDVREIEKLFMKVMKKELNAIVNLGAVLGFILGVINIFI